MRVFQYAMACAVALSVQLSALHAEPLTLDEAMRLAAERHPETHMAQQGVNAARGRLHEQSSYAHNPSILIEPKRRRLAGQTGATNDYMITLSQGLEIPGKRGSRKKAARAVLDAAEASAENVRQQRMIAAARAAVTLAFAIQTEHVRQQQKNTMKRLLDAVNQSFKAGEKSILDVNLARASFASAASLAAQAAQQRLRAEQDLANALGLSDKTRLDIHVLIPSLDPEWKPAKNAVEIALASRPDIQAMKAWARAGEAKARLASLNRIPDPALSLLAGRDTNDRILGFGVNIPLPVFNSHNGAYKAAIAERERAREMAQWSIVKLKREVTTAIREHEVAARTLAAYLQGRTPAAEDNIRLAQTAYEHGEMDLSDLVIYLDRSLQARITRLELVKRLWLARIRVAEVLGHPEYILKGTRP